MQNNAKKPVIRFAGFNDAWEQRKFTDLFDTVANNTLSRAELTADTGAGRDVHYGNILVKLGECLRDVSELPFIANDQTVQKFISAKLQSGDVIIADTAEDETVGKYTEVLDVQGEIVLAGLHTIPCRPKEIFALAYLGYFMNSPAYHDQLRPLMQGIKVTSVSKSALQDAVFPCLKANPNRHKSDNFFSASTTLSPFISVSILDCKGYEGNKVCSQLRLERERITRSTSWFSSSWMIWR